MKALGVVQLCGIVGEPLETRCSMFDLDGSWSSRILFRSGAGQKPAWKEVAGCRGVFVDGCVSNNLSKTTWVDTQNGDDRSPAMRCRLVATNGEV